MPRFVILTHDHPFGHWDFMFEHRGRLRTWRLLDAPQADAAVVAQPLGDHRLHYLDYEGPLSRNRGAVKRWDSGNYELVAEAPARIELCVRGSRLDGTIVLEAADSENWTCRFSPAESPSSPAQAT